LQLYWWRLILSHANNNEYHQLELSGAWEPLTSS